VELSVRSPGTDYPARAEISAAEIVAWARDLVDPALRMAVRRLPAETAELAGYHLGWQSGPGGGGKAIRPALAFLSAEAVGGTAASAIDAAVAVELVHNFSLLHDDVMDGDRTRRHRPTAWVVFGIPAAILAGDALLVLATQVLAESDGPLAGHGPAWLGEALLTLVEGQCADLTLAGRDDVGLADCLAMASGKTGALLGAACALGAFAGGGSPEQSATLRQFGEHLGLALQLVDDLLGIWGDPRVTGKPVRADLAARKKSLPVVAALTSGGPAARELAERYATPQPLGEAGALAVAGLIERAGGRAWAQAEARRQLGAALACLAEARPEQAAAGRLTRIAHMVTDRDR
jgi:geranylgeranyl diphosphate synthase, type I